MSSFEIYVKSSSEMITKKLETMRRKKRALDDIFNEGKISQMTYEYISKDLSDNSNEIEGRQKVLADRIASKITELEEQTRTLEMFLANLALGYAVGEVTDDMYNVESRSLALGLENAKRELSNLRDTLLSTIPEPTEEVEAPAEEPTEMDVSEGTIEETEAPIEEVVEAQAEEEAAVEETVEENTEEMSIDENEVYFEAPSEDMETSTEEMDDPSEIGIE
jgi:hypothetical protein